MASFHIRDFGPLAEAEVELKPLTVFIGPNNSGKSYLALAIYSIFRALSGTPRYAINRGRTGYWRWRANILEGDRKKVRSVLRKYSSDIEQLMNGDKKLIEMPRDVRALVEVALDGLANSYASDVEEEFQRCFGTDIRSLGRRGPRLPNNEIAIGINELDSGLDWEMGGSQDRLITKNWNPQIASMELGPNRFRLHPRIFASDPEIFAEYVPRRFFDRLIGSVSSAAHYLPASRTGILQGHKTLASLIVGRSSLAWIEPMEIPRLPGVVIDLIQALLLLGRPHKPTTRLARVVEFLEENVTKGIVDIDLKGQEYPDINYVNESGKFQLHQVSSMVSEVAPLVLFLKYLIDPGDLFIIEEPESHIDAATQRNLARAIAMMVNAGVRVLVTTHSDFFLNQINSLMLISQISPRKRLSMGYKANEVLGLASVAAYLFHPGTEGTNVERLEVDSDYGIPTNTSDIVHRALYDEAIKLEHRV